MALSAARAHSHRAEQADTQGGAALFKEDRPRRIDQFISFFGDEDEHDSSSEPLLDSFGGGPWSER